MKCLETRHQGTRPVGYGMTGQSERQIVLVVSRTYRLGSYRSLRDASCLLISQAFHAWLPSFRPLRDNVCPPYVDAHSRPQAYIALYFMAFQSIILRCAKAKRRRSADPSLIRNV